MNICLRAVALWLVFACAASAAELALSSDKDMATLQNASFYSIGGVGIIGKISSEEAAYNAILKQPDAITKFQKLLATANSPGQMYALLGLSRLDKKAFEAAAPQYRAHSEPVQTMEGCIGGVITPKDFVKRLESGKAP